MKIEPYLFFGGRAEEAIEFYKKAIGAKVPALMRFKDSPDNVGFGAPAGSENKIMHANLQIGETTVMVSDGQCQGESKFDGFALSISAANPDEVNRLFSALAQ